MNSALNLLNIIHHWDTLALRVLSSRDASGTLTRLAKTISFSGNGYAYLVTPVFLFIFDFSQIPEFVRIAISAIVAERLIYAVMKRGLKRRRPATILSNYHSVIEAGDEFSFPSGHTSAAFLIVSLLVLFYGSVFVIFYLWAGLVALSRLVLGVHFPTDLLFGGLLGSSVAYLTFAQLL